MSGKEKRNIGVLAHVDAGKTTITESFLFKSGLSRKFGSVDTGSAITDSMKVEKERGISVRSACVSFEWRDTIINLLDTPGHVDFSAEVERVLRVLDGAIVVMSAVEGVQAHTITLVETLKGMKIPFIVYINKIDRDGADFEQVIKSIKKDLKLISVPVWVPENEGDSEASIKDYWGKSYRDNSILDDDKIIESIVELDDNLMEKYLDGDNIESSSYWESAKTSINKGDLIPVYCGVAKNGTGIEELLDGVVSFLPKSKEKNKSKLSALVYKVEHDKLLGRLAHIRVFEGELKSKETVFCPRLGEERKVGITRKIYLHKLEDIESIRAGDIGVITGISDIVAGDILGEQGTIPNSIVMQNPVMTVQVKPKNDADYNDLSKALLLLESEDPNLSLKWYKEEHEFYLKIIGKMQIEILENQILERFSIETSFEDPQVIYKERPLKKAEGFIRYWMPKPCWAIMTFLIEPGELGSGVVYESKVRQSDIHLKYQNEVERTIPRALKQGIKGWEVTDIKITLISGEDHEMHSKPGDFILATPMGIMKGLEASGTEFLEPVLDFIIKAQEELLGRVASDLTRMRARFANPSFENGAFTLSGTVPVATSMDYSIKLSSLTSGRGRIVYKFAGYEPCTDNHGVYREYRGVNPLDESKWILHQRGAYKADERVR